MLLLTNYFSFSSNHPFVLFAIFTKNNITGTSTNTPTIVANVAGDETPNNAIDTATDNQKNLMHLSFLLELQYHMEFSTNNIYHML